ncbi:MAG TPA: ribose-phosphate diphosphokinase, partial [Ktedonobacterales bacterium]|nr:ribose-phosphate diphosphokinase [Ktedonobacterales bacterium]
MSAAPDERLQETISLQVLTTEGQEIAGLVTPPAIVSGSANVPLAEGIAAQLNVPLMQRRIERFPDGETYVRFESSVRGRDAFVIQPTCTPVNEHIFELLLLIDTLRRASAGRVTAIIPYYGYARQDRKFTGRDPISAKLVANLITAAGATRVLAVDLHSPAIQGFFDIGMDHLSAIQLLAEYLKGHIPPNSVIVSPDTGGVKRADLFARLLDLPIAILHKRRDGPHEVEIGAVIGDIRDKYPIIVDDIISTGGTVRKAVDTLVQAGARPQVRVVATHGVLVGEAPRLLRHPALVEIVVTDTVPIPPAIRAALPQL